MLWNIRFGAELIREEGEYGILACGRTIDTWILEFYGDKWSLAKDRAKSASPVEDFQYRVNAEVLFISNGVCVLDFGIKTVGEISDPQLLGQLSIGSYLSGEITVGMTFCTEVIPENLAQSMNYRMRIEQIFEDTARLVKFEGNRVFRPATESPRFREVESTNTDAYEYILRCSEIPPEA